MANTNYDYQSLNPASKRQQASETARQAYGSTNSSLYYGIPNATGAGNEYATTYSSHPHPQQRQNPSGQNWDWYTQIGRPSSGQGEAGLAGSNANLSHPSSTRSGSTSLYDTTNLGSLAYASTLDPALSQTQTSTQQLSQRTFAADNYIINRGGVVPPTIQGHAQELSTPELVRADGLAPISADAGSVGRLDQRFSPGAIQPYKPNAYEASQVGGTYPQNAVQQRTPMNTAVPRTTGSQLSRVPNPTARESILEKYAQRYSSGQEQSYDSRISSNFGSEGKRSPVQQAPTKRKHADISSTRSYPHQQTSHHGAGVISGAGSPANQISSYATPVQTTHKVQNTTPRSQIGTQSTQQPAPAQQTSGAQVPTLEPARRETRTYMPQVYNRYPEAGTQSIPRASSPPRPTTVDPSHVYDRYHEYQRQIEAAYAEQARIADVKAAEEAAAAEAKAAEDAAAIETKAAEAQAAEAAHKQARALQLQEETARRALAAQTSLRDSMNTIPRPAQGQEVESTNSSNDHATEIAAIGEGSNQANDAAADPVVEAMEAEMRAMVEKMREYQSRDPKLFVHVWESVKKGQSTRPGSSPAATALRSLNSPTFASRPPVPDLPSKTTNDAGGTAQREAKENAFTSSEQAPGKKQRIFSDAVVAKRAAKKVDQAAEKAATKERARLQRAAARGNAAASRALSGAVNTHVQNTKGAATTLNDSSTVVVPESQQVPSPVVSHLSNNVQQMTTDTSGTRHDITTSHNEAPLSHSPQVSDEPLLTQDNAAVLEQLPPESRVSASYPAGLVTNSAAAVPRRETPILPPTRPKSYPPKAEVIWPVQYRDALANTAASVLNSLSENAGKSILPKQIREMLDRNPSYTQLCDIIDETGFKMNRGRFAKTLLSIIPTTKPAAVIDSTPPSAPVGAVLVPAVTSALPVSNIEQRHDELNKELPKQGAKGPDANGTPRRGRGRPRKDGLPPFQTKALRTSDGNQISVDPNLEEGGEVSDRIDFISFSSTNAIAEANKHLKAIKPFKCMLLKAGTDRVCNMTFTLQQGLTRHQEMLHANRPDVLCSLCSPAKHFARLDALYRHNRNFHPDRTVDSSAAAVTPVGAVEPQTMPHTSAVYRSPYNSRSDETPSTTVADLQISPWQTPRTNEQKTTASNSNEEQGTKPIASARTITPEPAHAQQQPIVRTKELAARKKTLAEIIKLTSDTVLDSIETDASADGPISHQEPVGVTVKPAKGMVRAASTAPPIQPRATSPSPIHSTTNSKIRNDEVNVKSADATLSEVQDESGLPVPNAHPLIDEDIAQPIDKSSALRKSLYNPKTIARDVLLSTSKHPEHRGLNAHLQGLITSFRKVDTNSDLASFKWDLVDPGGPLTGSATVAVQPTDNVSLQNSAKSEHSRVGGLASATPSSTMMNSHELYRRSSMLSPAGSSLKRHRDVNSRQYMPTSPSGLRNENHAILIEDDEDISEQVYDSADYMDPGQSTMRPVVEIPLKSPEALFQRSPQTKFPIRSAPLGDTPRKRPGRPPKQDGESSASKIVKRIGRPPKRTLEEKLSSFEVEPKFVPFACEWRDCKAELQNMDTLKRHVRAVHVKKPTSEGFGCHWNLCGSVVPSIFPEESVLQEHVNEAHLVPYSWHMGDGPRGSSIDSASSASLTFLTDASGRQITPSVLNPLQHIEAGSASVNNRRRWEAQQDQPDPLLGTGLNLAGIPPNPDLMWHEDRDKEPFEDGGSTNRIRDRKKDKELADAFEVVLEKRRRGEIEYTSPDIVESLTRKAAETFNKERAALAEAAGGTAYEARIRAPRGRPRGRIASIGRMQMDNSGNSTALDGHEHRRGRGRGRGVVPNRGSRGRPRGRPRGV